MAPDGGKLRRSVGSPLAISLERSFLLHPGASFLPTGGPASVPSERILWRMRCSMTPSLRTPGYVGIRPWIKQPSSRQPCHNVVVHTSLAVTAATDTFNADYYLAIVTILPILMVAVEVLTNFNKSIPVQIVEKWPLPFQFGLVFFYLFSPIIAAAGVIVGVLALMFRDTNAAYQWSTFGCLGGVLGFIALSSTTYLLVFDTAQTAAERKDQKTPDPPDSGDTAS